MLKNSRNTLMRIVLVSLYALASLMLIRLLMPKSTGLQLQIPKGFFLFFYILTFNLNVEGNLFFDRYLNRKRPWYYNPQKRLFIQIGIIILWTFICIAIPFTIQYFINGQSLIYPKAPVIIFICSVVFSIGFISISIAINFFKQWKDSLLDAEHYKQEKLMADYRVLQNQVNPHFLFNSLNVLISEIKHDPNTAVDFTRRLSKVYRYVLQSKNHDLIRLSKELEFIDSFIYLHKVRIGNALDYSVNISEEVKQLMLPPLTLQILIENAIKHNIANEENVLKISIESGRDNTLTVSNNIQIIDTVNSTYTGLANLSKRFELIKKEGFTYGKQEGKFVVTIPLIEE